MLSTILYRNYLSYMDYRKAFLDSKDVQGAYVELGFGSGTSANIFTQLIVSGEISNRPIRIFDSFKGLPKPSEKDLSFDNTLQKGKFSKPVHPALDLRFEIPKTDYKVIRGYVEDTVPLYEGLPIGILNLDLSTYSSTKICLEHLHKHLIKFGTLLIPSYINNIGVKTAVNEFFTENGLQHLIEETTTFINTLAPVKLTPKGKRDESFEEKRVPKKVAIEPEPFKDRYKKKPVKDIIYNKTVRTDVKVLGKKVTR